MAANQIGSRSVLPGVTREREWIIARSGGALIVLMAALVILFGIRYLYPILRRGLV